MKHCSGLYYRFITGWLMQKIITMLDKKKKEAI